MKLVQLDVKVILYWQPKKKKKRVNQRKLLVFVKRSPLINSPKK